MPRYHGHAVDRAPRTARLTSRPHPPAGGGTAGLHPLGLETDRDGLLYVPAGSITPDRPAPLIITLHGAGGNARGALSALTSLADAHGVLLLAPESRLQTWDVIYSGFGPDITFIDRALAQTFDHYSIDPARIAVEGFSDGASYALSVGIGNGDLATHVLAFSPGFAAPAAREGCPSMFVSHGIRDKTLPIAVCSRRIVPRLRAEGYEVVYREFDGPHTVPASIAKEAVDWFLGAPSVGTG